MVVSHYYRVRVHDTNEEQIFANYLECLAWMEKVKQTFGDEKMLFDVIEITERLIPCDKGERG